MKQLKSIIAVFALIAIFAGSVKLLAEGTGKDIFLAKKCNTCHAIKDQGVESKQADKYPDLSKIGGKEGINVEFLTKYLQKEADLNGKKHAIKFKGEEAELTTLVKWLVSLK